MFTRTLFVIPLLAACQASASAQMQAKGTGDLDGNASATLNADHETELGSGRNGAPAAPVAQKGYADGGGYSETTDPVADALLGARAGLRLAKPSAASCQCLGVQVSNPSDVGFVWEGPAPTTNPNTQLVIGISSEGLPCPQAASDSLGASYRGYEVVGADVMVLIETGRLGRPIAQGAVIPKPSSGGRVFVRANDDKSPYGRSLDGQSATCLVWPKH